MRRLLTFLLLTWAAPLLGAQGALCVLDQASLQASDGAASDGFGLAVSVDGDWAAFGAPADDDQGANSGSVHVFRRAAGVWTFDAKLTASDGQAFDAFGTSVALAGDVLAVGAPGADGSWTNSGCAYVFRLTGGAWTEETTLVANDAFEHDRLGDAIAADGDTILVGAPDEFFTAGSVYAFRFDGSSWALEQKLASTPVVGNAAFGTSVALHGDLAVVGAPFDDDGAAVTGAAHVFTRAAGVWTYAAELLASDANADDEFGHAVGCANGVVVVGAPGEDAGGAEAGAAYAFRPVGGLWTELEKLQASDAAAGDRFGTTVAASGNLVTVGAPGRDAGAAADAGACYVFLADGVGWPERATLLAATPSTNASFGRTLASDRDTLVAGAPTATGATALSGAGAAFRVSGAWDAYGTGLAGTGGLAPTLSATPSCPTIGDAPVLEITGGVGGAPGLLLLGQARTSFPIYGGTLLVAPPLFGQIPHVLGGSPGVAGAGSIVFPLQPTTDGLFGLAAHAQAGYLDAGAPQLVTLTNGLRLGMP